MDVKQLLIDLGVTNIQDALADYERYIKGEPRPMSLSTDWNKIDWDSYFEKHKGKTELADFAGYARLLHASKVLRDAYQKFKDWDKVIENDLFIDDFDFSEAFVDLIEEMYQTTVKDDRHLMELTGCQDYKERDKVSLQDDIYSARWTRYNRALAYALEAGAKYPDLVNMKPETWGLPKKWTGTRLATNQHEAILWAIKMAFYLDEGRLYSPGLRLVANELEAPYSVVMEAYKGLNG